ncbi:MAG TPA: glycosyltransferase family 2 protein [Candidatus Xenobia bacterium]|jgi:glycosyltransferase involved in cell wall biosynthesis
MPAALDLVAARVAVVIPACNEEASLPHVLADLPPVWEVIVVDNNSRDATVSVARARGARVVAERVQGYGFACLAGIASLSPETRIVVFLDADYSDDPGELPAIVGPLLDGSADLVIGSRMRDAASRAALPPHARFGNWLASTLMRLWYGLEVTDVGPFRALPRAHLERLDMEPAAFRWTTEMMVKAARLGWRVREVPVRYRARIGQSKISGTIMGSLKAAWFILGTIFRYRRWRPDR